MIFGREFRERIFTLHLCMKRKNLWLPLEMIWEILEHFSLEYQGCRRSLTWKRYRQTEEAFQTNPSCEETEAEFTLARLDHHQSSIDAMARETLDKRDPAHLERMQHLRDKCRALSEEEG